jgi:DNA ligase-associated metallophosphoesterase
VSVSAQGHALTLLPQGAVWLEADRTLLVADVHLGKAASFRALGVPVPEGTTAATLARLSALVEALRPAALVVLGDLLHGPAAHAAGVVDALAAWRRRFAGVRMVLVRGNHDDRAGDPPPRCGFEVADEPFALAGLALCHAPRALAGRFVLAGHLHPARRLSTRVDALRLPCFWLRPAFGVLPAFGEFTGGWAIREAPGDRVFVTDGERVHPLPPVVLEAR